MLEGSVQGHYILSELVILRDPILEPRYLVRWRARSPGSILSCGKYVFDIKDPIIEIILEKSEIVLSNKNIEYLVEIYFRCLAAFSTPHGIVYAMSGSSLILLEKGILGLLQYEGAYKPLHERIGLIATQLIAL
jgi:hypothetical protein